MLHYTIPSPIVFKRDYRTNAWSQNFPWYRQAHFCATLLYISVRHRSKFWLLLRIGVFMSVVNHGMCWALIPDPHIPAEMAGAHLTPVVLKGKNSLAGASTRFMPCKDAESLKFRNAEGKILRQTHFSTQHAPQWCSQCHAGSPPAALHLIDT